MKKNVKKTKTTINTVFPLCRRSVILESLFLNTCFLGLKAVKKTGHIYFFMTFNESFGGI